jgi:hypothetical protein
MGWNAIRTNRGTLHVLNDQTLEHFEAADEAEAEANIVAYNAAKAAAVAEVVPIDTTTLTVPVAEPVVNVE